MTDTVIPYRFVVRRGTRAALATANETPKQGEFYLETDTGRVKLGDGATAYNSLRYFGAGVRVLTDAETIAIDASLSDNFRVVLGGNRTLGNPSNLVDGQTFNLRIKQDGTGSRTLAYASKWKFPGGVAPVLSTAAGAGDLLSAQYDATNDTIYAVLNKAFS